MVMITAVTVKIRVDMAIVTVVTVTNIMDTAKVMADTAMAMVDMAIAMADMVIAKADMVIITVDTEEVTAIQNILAPVTVTKVIPRVTQPDLLPTVPKAMVDTNDDFNQTSLNE